MNQAASLIISVYNNEERLKLVFAGLSRQTYKNYEVLIADDGSGNKMREFIDQFQESAIFPIKHIWQDDIGFRKNRILNEAIKIATTDYLIFIDGDCIPHKNFIQAHVKERELNTVLCGSRVMLSDRMSTNITLETVSAGKLEGLNFNLLFDALTGKASRLEDGIYIPSGFNRKFRNNRKVNILGSNYSIEKSLIEKINGFDEDYIGPGLGEDSDIQFRLKMLGARFKSVRNYAILYHLYHPKTAENSENMLRFEKKKKLQKMFCTNGLIKFNQNQ